jgi:hypothetical protein
LASVFIVEVIGYGGGDGQSQPSSGTEPQQPGTESSDQRTDKKN